MEQKQYTDRLYTKENELVICECGGYFIQENRVLLTEPPQYPFRCNKCGKRKIQRHDKTIYEM